MAAKDEMIVTKGRVTDASPGARFKVRLENGHVLNAVISGKIRKNNIQILLDDFGRFSCPNGGWCPGHGLWSNVYDHSAFDWDQSAGHQRKYSHRRNVFQRSFRVQPL